MVGGTGRAAASCQRFAVLPVRAARDGTCAPRTGHGGAATFETRYPVSPLIEVVIDSNGGRSAACRRTIEQFAAGTPIRVVSRLTADWILAETPADVTVVTSPTHEWTSDTLDRVAAHFVTNPTLDLLYGPETDLQSPEPWSPARLRHSDYLGGIVALSGNLARRLRSIRTEYYPHHRWDLVLRAAEHEPKVAVADSPLAIRINSRPALLNPECIRRGCTVLEHHLARCGVHAAAEVTADPTWFSYRQAAPPTPRTSLIIPALGTAGDTAGESLRLAQMIRTLRDRTATPPHQTLVIVGKPLRAPATQAIESAWPAVQVIATTRPTALKWRYLDAAARLVTGDVAIVLDEDVDIDNRDWLTTLAKLAVHPAVGAVSATPANHLGTTPLDRRPTVTRAKTMSSGCVAMRRQIFVRMHGLLAERTGLALPVLLRRRNLNPLVTDHVVFDRVSPGTWDARRTEQTAPDGDTAIRQEPKNAHVGPSPGPTHTDETSIQAD